MKSRFCTIVGILSLLFIEIPVCYGLDCYHCTDGWTSDSCTDSVIACSTGEICSNTAIRKQFYGRLYTKGCMEPNSCYDLQLLNDRKTCLETPSTCVYCCDEQLCNKGETTHDSSLKISIFLAVLSLCVS